MQPSAEMVHAWHVGAWYEEFGQTVQIAADTPDIIQLAAKTPAMPFGVHLMLGLSCERQAPMACSTASSTFTCVIVFAH